ncbi:MAG: T9SS type A sorting domain-containing protein [bacterium]|nr:T9SS type A sorting domain-containing protein [bacterium]
MKTLRFVVLLVALVATTAGLAQQQPIEVWRQNFTMGGSGDFAFGASLNGDGSIIVVGDRFPNATAAITKFSSSGQQLWTTLDTTIGTISFLGHSALFGDGAIAWFSGSESQGWLNSTITCLTPSGNWVWRIVVNGLFYLGRGPTDTTVVAIRSGDAPVAVIIGRSGTILRQFPVGEYAGSNISIRSFGSNLLVGAHYRNTTGAKSFYVAKYNVSSGQELWRQNFDSMIRGFMDIDESGNPFVAGSVVVPPNSRLKFLEAKITSTTGAIVWQEESVGPTNPFQNWVNGITVSPVVNGKQEVVMFGAVGRTDSNSINDATYALSRRASDGQRLWVMSWFDNSTSNVITGGVFDRNGDLILVEMKNSPNRIWKFAVPTLSVREVGGLPETFSLSQNYPNPFNPSTTIKFEIMEATKVHLAVYDLLGRPVEVLVNERLTPGVYEARFEPKGLASGVYLYRLVTEKSVAKRKMLLLK